jgi:hypothetical protein
MTTTIVDGISKELRRKQDMDNLRTESKLQADIPVRRLISLFQTRADQPPEAGNIAAEHARRSRLATISTRTCCSSSDLSGRTRGATDSKNLRRIP